jgi:hypothetical protein
MRRRLQPERRHRSHLQSLNSVETASVTTQSLTSHLHDVRDGRISEEHLVDGARPSHQVHSTSRILIVGQHAVAWHLDQKKQPFTDTVRAWKDHRPGRIPHPSPRNNIWLKKNPWSETDVLPYLRRRVRTLFA